MSVDRDGAKLKVFVDSLAQVVLLVELGHVVLLKLLVEVISNTQLSVACRAPSVKKTIRLNFNRLKGQIVNQLWLKSCENGIKQLLLLGLFNEQNQAVDAVLGLHHHLEGLSHSVVDESDAILEGQHKHFES